MIHCINPVIIIVHTFLTSMRSRVSLLFRFRRQ